MAASASLATLGEKTLPHAADPSLLAYCPSMDLIALGTTDQQVLIYRLNGQRVYGAAQKTGTLVVESIRWKPNGLSPSKIHEKGLTSRRATACCCLERWERTSGRGGEYQNRSSIFDW